MITCMYYMSALVPIPLYVGCAKLNFIEVFQLRRNIFLKGGGGERLEVQDLKKYKRGDELVC